MQGIIGLIAWACIILLIIYLAPKGRAIVLTLVPVPLPHLDSPLRPNLVIRSLIAYRDDCGVTIVVEEGHGCRD